MRLIIPMAGMGKRLRPHTLTTPKPLIKVGGKSIVHWLIKDIADVCGESIEEIGFVVGRFGDAVESELKDIAKSVGAEGKIFYQDVAEGTGHAILCARECLKGDVIVAFADTLFRTEFNLDKTKDGVIWVHKVDNPSSFGVVKYNEENIITDFVEKPTEFVSDLAIIGIYYFKSGETLEIELQYLIDNNLKEKGEYQLTNAMENMKTKGMQFVPGAVDEWLDCGNYAATVYTNQRVLANNAKEFADASSRFDESVTIIEPCFIGDGVSLKNCQIGPFVSIGNKTELENCKISNTIIQENCSLRDFNCHNSMIGNSVAISGAHIASQVYSLGDFSSIG
ncbi:MAG: nucleotidyltransferase [Flavobacteriaceae bacterium]|nr:nucleotidyltransferase [Flavobacteriaceae bacterium]